MNTKLSKDLVYPLYNVSLSLTERLILKLGGPIKCPVCGRLAKLTIASGSLRENCICNNCHSINRQRQIAYVITKRMGLRSINDLAKLDDFVVYNTESSGALHSRLLQLNNYLFSEFFGSNHKSGDMVNSIMHQDLMALSFKDESVDLVISSDVFEHVSDPYKAHEEIYRVLKLGGKHVFTVPFYLMDYLDENRAQMDLGGEVTHLKEPMYHEDPVREKEGALVFNIFALEMIVKLAKIGFRTNMYKLNAPLNGIFAFDAIVFEAIKEASQDNYISLDEAQKHEKFWNIRK